MRRLEREVRDDFVRAGAVSPANAMSLSDIGVHEGGAVRRLRNRAVVREAAPGLFYFDEEVYESVRSMRRRMAFIMLVVVISIFLLVTFGVATFR